MKLLIVDDEELTRTGVISSIEWNTLGIDEVLQADDGVHGLEAARLYQPEIILCDVRMPRMDGITMLEQIERILPDTVSIFMSGYSDKEYLKAAIKLKAVNYIEKPLDPQEIREAVAEARELYLHKVHSRRAETMHSIATASRLALHLTIPFDANNEALVQLCRDLSLPMTSGTYFTAFIVKHDMSLEPAQSSVSDICQELNSFLKSWHMNCIYAEKRVQYLVYFLYGAASPSPAVIKEVGEFLNSRHNLLGRHFIAAGDTFPGISRAYQSYESAVILLQSSFFFPENTVLTSEILSETPEYPEEPHQQVPEAALAEALTSMDYSAVKNLLHSLEGHFSRNHTLLPNQVKDLYYKLFLTLEDARRQRKLTDSASSVHENISDTMEQCFSFCELHHVLDEKVEKFFQDARNASEENPTIFLIKDYISKNYMNETLSVKDISTHVFLSTSYVCTFFKNETGQTLNQYLTEYRMERAKQLLGDSRYKITEISSRVGYSDGNYFGKSFKKYSGLSPSEYREKILQ